LLPGNCREGELTDPLQQQENVADLTSFLKNQVSDGGEECRAAIAAAFPAGTWHIAVLKANRAGAWGCSKSSCDAD
jgi:hypothetical protein